MNKRLLHPLSLQMLCSPWPQSRAPVEWRGPRRRGQQHSGLLPGDLFDPEMPLTQQFRAERDQALQASSTHTSLQHPQKPEGFRTVPGKDSDNPGIMGPSGLSQPPG